jgi:hypothetical protein
MKAPSHDELKKQIHRAEEQISAIASKIENSDDANTYPADYAAMRSEQEAHRQAILKCEAEIDSSLSGEPHVD